MISIPAGASWTRRRLRRAHGDDGFTLIELMVVLLIMAILLAIAIPTFLGTTRSANNRVVQSNLNSALSNAALVYQQGGQTYGNGTASSSTSWASYLTSTLNSGAPAILFTTGPSTGPTTISIWVSPDGNGIVLAGLSLATKTCWYLLNNSLPQATTVANGAYQYLSGYTAFTAGSSVASGTWYGEVAALGTTSNCVASHPIAFVSDAVSLFSTSGFPSLANG